MLRDYNICLYLGLCQGNIIFYELRVIEVTAMTPSFVLDPPFFDGPNSICNRP